MTAIIRKPDRTMERLNRIARILRYRHGYKGYIHLKIIPGASDAAGEKDSERALGQTSPRVFPLDINRASMDQLIRVPGVGKITANRIPNRRKTLRIKCIEDIGRPTALLKKAGEYLCF